MSLNSIMNIQKQRKLRRNQVFKDIFEKVKIRINHYTRFGQTNCTYTVPPIIYGLPHINLAEIADYIERKLKEEGFMAVRMNATNIYISWEETVIAEQRRRNKEKQKMKKKEKELLKLEDDRNKDLLNSIVSYD